MNTSSDCRICYLRFESPGRVPKNLGCGHCYCLECLQSQEAKTGVLKCFECSEVVMTKPEELVTNFILLSDASAAENSKNQYFCMSCKKEANFGCEKDGHPFVGMAAYRAKQTERSRNAAQAHKSVLENVLSKVMEVQAVVEAQLHKTMEEQDKVGALLQRLTANDAGGSGLQDAMREGVELEEGLPLAERGRQLLRLDKGSCRLSIQSEAGAGVATATLDLAALAAQRPDVLAVAQYLFFLLGRNGLMQPQNQQRVGGGGGGGAGRQPQQRGAPGFNGRAQHAGHGDAALVRGLANMNLAVEITDDGVLDLKKNNIGESSPSEMIAEKSALLRSTKRVIELTGLNCDKDPTFCSKLIQKHAPYLENVTLHKIQQEHFNLLGSLRRLKNLKLVGHSGRLAAHLQPQPDCQVRSLYMHLPIPVQLSLWDAFASSLMNVTVRIEVQTSVDVHVTLRRPLSRTPNLRTLHLHRKSTDQHNPADCGRQMDGIRGVLPPGTRLTCNMCGTDAP